MSFLIWKRPGGRKSEGSTEAVRLKLSKQHACSSSLRASEVMKFEVRGNEESTRAMLEAWGRLSQTDVVQNSEVCRARVGLKYFMKMTGALEKLMGSLTYSPKGGNIRVQAGAAMHEMWLETVRELDAAVEE